jgi:hypothetical protein
MQILLAQASANVNTNVLPINLLGKIDISQTSMNYAMLLVEIIGIVLIIVLVVSIITFFNTRAKVKKMVAQTAAIPENVKQPVGQNVWISRWFRCCAVGIMYLGAYLVDSNRNAVGYQLVSSEEADSHGKGAIIGLVLMLFALCVYIAGVVIRFRVYRTTLQKDLLVENNNKFILQKDFLLRILISTGLQLINIFLIWSILSLTAQY